MDHIYQPIKRFLKDESGASLIEYSILIGIITVAAIGSIGVMGGRVSTWWATLVSSTS